MTPPDAAERLKSDVVAARKIVNRHCSEYGCLRMCIPVREDDEDQVLHRVIDAADHLADTMIAEKRRKEGSGNDA